MISNDFHLVGVAVLLVSGIMSVSCQKSARGSASSDRSIREKRGAAYAGAHPGNGNGHYPQGGIGIPGLSNAREYAAYSTLLNHGQHPSSGYGQSRHGRKLTVSEAIGMFGHHTLTKSYPYTQDANAIGTSYNSGGGGGSSGYNSSPAGSNHGGGAGGGGGGGGGRRSYGS